MSLGELETARRVGANFVTVVFNNAASGYVKALQHAVYGAGNYQSSDLVEMDYAAIAQGDSAATASASSDPDKLGARAARMASPRPRRPTVIDCVVTRDPARCCPPSTTARSRCRRAIARSESLSGGSS